MVKERLKLPIGVESFEEIRTDGFYYVDKTKLIEELLNQWGKVNLFTRPRRFGKSLNMSMLRSFFEIGAKPEWFEGLYISENTALCEAYMGKFPVVSISLKGVNGATYEEAKGYLIKVINREARRLQFLMDSPKLTRFDRELFDELLRKNMDDETLTSSLQELSELLEKHFGEKVIVLIDEYDVPLAKANENGFYDEMALLIRNLFENVLKTNDSLKFAVLTGCLRVVKESIFTGLNNFKVYPITSAAFDEYFGFMDAEVKELLHAYDLDETYETVKAWYDGYRFGKADVYCPWDVVNYCSDHINDLELPPQNYWINTSGNETIYHFIDEMGEKQKLTKAELEALVNGESVQKEINEELTYKELYASTENIWSALLMTGYLTKRGDADGKRYHLVVPNQEIRNIITEHILMRFRENVVKDGAMAEKFCRALADGKPEEVERVLTEYMEKTISVRDTFVHVAIKENFYHGMLLGIVSYKSGWLVNSNRESGDGFSDIMIRDDAEKLGIIIEVKYAEDGKEDIECRNALRQIEVKKYGMSLRQMGVEQILNYGIACNRKRCRVMMERSR